MSVNHAIGATERKLWKYIHGCNALLTAILEARSFYLAHSCVNLISWASASIQELEEAREFGQTPVTADRPDPVTQTETPKTSVKRTRRCHGERNLTDFTKQAFSVLLCLNGGEKPISVTDAATKTWPNEDNPLRSTKLKLAARIYAALEYGLPLLRQVVQTREIPEPDQTFYQQLFVRYPDLKAEQLDALLAMPDARKKRVSNPAPPPARKLAGPQLRDEDKGAITPLPTTEWLKPLWAVFFHPGGPTLEKSVLMSRTNLGERFVQPIITGGLKNLHSILLGKMENPEPAFTQALSQTWPNKDVAGVLASISNGGDGEISLTVVLSEITDEQQPVAVEA